MLTVVKRPLSFQTNGLPKIVGTTSTASALTILAHSNSTVFDEVFLFGYLDQTKTAAVTMTLVINSQSYSLNIPIGAIEYPILTGHRLQGNTSASDGGRIEIFASSTANLHLCGYVNRITES